MPVTDQIADFITRIRNAGAAGHKLVESPRSNLKLAVAAILKDNGFIENFEDRKDEVQGTILVTLRYYKREPAIREIKRVSTPGRRVYASSDNLPRVQNGLGISIISTSKGVLSDKDARRHNVGGEVLCTVW